MASMYMVSCRREFWSANEFATTDEIRNLDLSGNGQAAAVPPATFLAMAGSLGARPRMEPRTQTSVIRALSRLRSR